MPRGKKATNRPSAGGIIRNDYHRPNRKENKSTHKHSFGRQAPASNAVDWMPRLNLDALIREAVARASRQKGIPPHLVGVKSACVNYLRHCFTDYDRQLNVGKTVRQGSRFNEYMSVSETVFKEIADTYPWLTDECQHQLEHRRRLASRTRLIKKDDWKARMIAAFNQQHGRPAVADKFERETQITYEDEGTVGEHTVGSLKLARLLYLPPFLKRDEIRQRRFGGQLQMNDRWWEWEEEKGIQSKDQERFRWAS